jgi:hypothetical protein
MAASIIIAVAAMPRLPRKNFETLRIVSSFPVTGGHHAGGRHACA